MHQHLDMIRKIVIAWIWILALAFLFLCDSLGCIDLPRIGSEFLEAGALREGKWARESLYLNFRHLMKSKTFTRFCILYNWRFFHWVELPFYPTPMVGDRILTVGTLGIEAVALLRLGILLIRYLRSQKEGEAVVPSVGRIYQKLTSWWKEQQIDHETAAELDFLRCRMVRKYWNFQLCVALVRLVTVQVFETKRLFPEFDFLFFFLGTIGLLFNCLPNLITPRSLDLWYVVTAVLFNLSLIPATYMDVRDVVAFTFAGRFIFAVLAKRTWAVVFCMLISLVQTLNMVRLQLQDMKDGENLSIGPVVIGVYFMMFAGIYVARRLLAENAILKMGLKVRTVEMGAVSSLLTACYDAVVEVDEDLRLADNSPQLSSMLLHAASNDPNGLLGRSLLDFFAEEDQERIRQQFECSIASESSSVMALNADMLDSEPCLCELWVIF